MALPSIANRTTDYPQMKLDLQKLQDEFEPEPSVRTRDHSSSRDSAHRRNLLHAGSTSNPTLNREKSSYSLTSRPFSRSRSGNDLRAIVTSRNIVRSAEKLHNDVTGRPPLPTAGSTGNLLSARVHPKPVRTRSNNSLLANPRSSSGSNSHRTTPVLQRKLSKGFSTPDVRQKGLSSSPTDATHDSPSSTPGKLRRRIVEYVDNSPESSRPSSGRQSSGNGCATGDGKTYRDVRIISNSATQRITESNISRKEKVIHIVHGAETSANTAANTTANTAANTAAANTAANTAAANTAKNDSKTTQKPKIELPSADKTPLTSRQSSELTDGHTHTGAQKGKSAEKLYINRDNIEPPPTPRVGVSADGEGLSKEVFMKCVDWLEGVHEANDHKTLDVVTLPPIEWND